MSLKYEKAKEAARAWHHMLEIKKKENKELQAELERWKKLSNELPDHSTVQDLENENKNHIKTIKTLKKQLSEIEEKYKDKIALLEREKLLAEGRIQQLEEARKDLQERYSDLKQDFREQQRWVRKENV
jgi:archaellum component FlaC